MPQTQAKETWNTSFSGELSVKYKDATALRRALQHHLRVIAKQEKITHLRLRRHLAFERLLARLFKHPSSPWVLKGGYAMELRWQNSRATRDVDLAMSEKFLDILKNEQAETTIYERLSKDLDNDIGDFFSFKVKKKSSDLAAPPLGGLRLYVDAILDNRLFVRFHVDVGIGDAEITPLETLTSRNLLAFAGVDCPPFPAIPQEQHFAEKIHAYTTLFDGQMGSRVKDLIDMVLLIQNGSMSTAKLATALHLTFDKHKKHPLPQALPAPPATWAEKFAALAAECEIELELEDAYTIVRDYYGQIGVA